MTRLASSTLVVLVTCALVPTAQAQPSPRDIARDYFTFDRSARAVTATADSALGVASEALQILGQIVVDRASQQAYRLIVDKVTTLLGCADRTKTRFPETCRAFAALRIQDLGVARSILTNALASDAVAALLAGLQGSDLPETVRDLLARSVRRIIVPLLGRPDEILTPHTIEALVRDIVHQALASLRDAAADHYCGLGARARTLALAALSFAYCDRAPADAACAVVSIVDALDRQCPAPLGPGQLDFARVLAGRLHDALRLTAGTVPRADGRARLAVACDAALDVACLFAHSDADTGYNCTIDHAATGTATTKERIAVLRRVLAAAIDGDGDALVGAVVDAAELAIRGVTGGAAVPTRALRVIGTVVAYARTYGGDEAAGATAAAHAQRTKLLESLTADMTARIDRGGDTIASFGGSLRLVGGARIGGGERGGRRLDPVYYGPLALPLGFGVDVVDAAGDAGWHLELGVVDLGQYLAWEDGAQVREPEVVDALAPSFTAARYWGTDLPFFVGLTVGVSPHYDFDSDAAGPLGALNVGATLGMYVPLVDFN